MTVKQLMESLEKMPPDAQVRLSISDPNDTAYTRDVNPPKLTNPSQSTKDGVVTIAGWVASDDEDAFSPWAREPYEGDDNDEI